MVAFLPVPIAALVYSLTAARSAPEPAAADANQRERRTIIVSAIVGIVIMTALGYLGNSNFLFFQFAHQSLANGEMALIAAERAVLAVAHAGRSTSRHCQHGDGARRADGEGGW